MATTNKKATKVASETRVDKTETEKKVATAKKAKGKPAVSEKADKPSAKKVAEKPAKEVKKASKTATATAPKATAKSNSVATATAPTQPEVKKAAKSAKTSKPSVSKESAKKSVADSKKAAVAAKGKGKSSKKAQEEVVNDEPATEHLQDHNEKLTKALKKSKEKTKPKKVSIPKTSTDKARKYEPEFTRSVLDQVPEEYEGPSLRYSDSDLVEFRELISKKLESAKKELGYLQGLITRKDQMGGDESENRYMTMEDGSLSMEREQLGQMASRQITFIDHLEKALMRIENKTYGVCRVTGKLIDKARLRAVPHATLSIEAKMGRN